MRIGVSFPTVEIGADLAVVRDYVHTAEELGYTHLRILDHVLGADPQFHPEVPVFYYTHESVTHEPFTLMAYLAALTTRLELTTAIIILPQRQTALVAKQAADEDEALGEDFRTRGRRSEEQIEVLRLLWTQEVVTYSGRWHQISHAGINPRPIQRPIPIWIGSGAPQTPLPPEAGMRRIARLADGWFPLFDLNDQGKAVIARIQQYTEEVGRAPGALGLEGRVNLAGTGPDDWIKAMQGWEAVGATHLSVSTGGKTFQTAREHLEALRRFKHEVGL